MSRRGLLGAVRAGARDLRGRDRERGDGRHGQHRLLQRDRARKICPQVMACNNDLDKDKPVLHFFRSFFVCFTFNR